MCVRTSSDEEESSAFRGMLALGGWEAKWGEQTLRWNTDRRAASAEASHGRRTKASTLPVIAVWLTRSHALYVSQCGTIAETLKRVQSCVKEVNE